MKLLLAIIFASTALAADPPLHQAVYRDDIAAAKKLLGASADGKATNRYGIAPLSLAAANGNAELMELLLKAGADAKRFS